MSVRHLRSLPVLCLLLLSLLTGPASTFGYVWCVSADGHTSLEEAVAGDCGLVDPAPTANDSFALSLSAGTDDCGPCLDVSSAPRWGTARTRHTEAPVTLPAPLVPIIVAKYLFLPGQFEPVHAFTVPLPRTPELLRQHRTIVLLI